MEDDVSQELAEFALANAIYTALVEGHAAEISARRTAMENASNVSNLNIPHCKADNDHGIECSGYDWIAAVAVQSRSAGCHHKRAYRYHHGECCKSALSYELTITGGIGVVKGIQTTFTASMQLCFLLAISIPSSSIHALVLIPGKDQHY